MKERVTSTIIKDVWKGDKHYDDFASSFRDRIPETYEELLSLCRNLEIATKDKKRYLYCTTLGEIYICLDDSFGKVGFCLTLRNIQNPNRDIIHVNIINFKQKILYNSFDISLANSIDFIQSVLQTWRKYDN